MIFVNIKMAFDIVRYEGLLLKLESLGVEGPAPAWLKHFLCGRRQRTSVGASNSDVGSLHGGVPQGAILSPLLFSVFMNDIVSATSARTNLFADDTSTFVCDTSLPAVERRLQVAVSNLEAWFNTWGLSVNISKSAVMVMSTEQSPKWINIQINGSSIPQVRSHKHLGLLLNDQLNWSDHVTYIVNKTSKKIGLLRRLKSRLHPIAVQSVYETCVRPTMEYTSLAWSGVSTTDSDQLE